MKRTRLLLIIYCLIMFAYILLQVVFCSFKKEEVEGKINIVFNQSLNETAISIEKAYSTYIRSSWSSDWFYNRYKKGRGLQVQTEEGIVRLPLTSYNPLNYEAFMIDDTHYMALGEGLPLYLNTLDSIFSLRLNESDIAGKIATQIHYLDLVKYFSAEKPVEEIEKHREMITVDEDYDFSQATFVTDTVRVGYHTQGLMVGYVTLSPFWLLIHNGFTLWGTITFLLILIAITVLFRWQEKWKRIKKLREARVITKEVEVEKEVFRVLSQLSAEEDKRITIGKSVLNPVTKELTCGDRIVRMQKQPLELLILLLNSPDKAISKEMLCEKLWSGELDVHDTADRINTIVYRLRKNLQIDESISLESDRDMIRLFIQE